MPRTFYLIWVPIRIDKIAKDAHRPIVAAPKDNSKRYVKRMHSLHDGHIYLLSHSRQVKMLRDRKANLWLRNAKGDLPLHEAAASGRRELVLWLLDQRPKHVNTTSNDGRTILHIAAGNDYTDMCKVCEYFSYESNSNIYCSIRICVAHIKSKPCRSVANSV